MHGKAAESPLLSGTSDSTVTRLSCVYTVDFSNTTHATIRRREAWFGPGESIDWTKTATGGA